MIMNNSRGRHIISAGSMSHHQVPTTTRWIAYTFNKYNKSTASLILKARRFMAGAVSVVTCTLQKQHSGMVA